jgi:DNA-directed RNA polymerase specialized sigma24 family protein
VDAIPRLAVDAAQTADVDPAEELALRARANAEAFAELYRLHREAVFRYLRVRCRDDELALEMTAVAFEKALRSIHRYQTKGGGVLAWLLRIARNAADALFWIAGS